MAKLVVVSVVKGASVEVEAFPVGKGPVGYAVVSAIVVVGKVPVDELSVVLSSEHGFVSVAVAVAVAVEIGSAG